MWTNISLLIIFGLLMRGMTYSWRWFVIPAVAYAAILVTVFYLGSFDDGRHMQIALRCVNSGALLVVCYGGGVVLMCAIISRVCGFILRLIERAKQGLPQSTFQDRQ